MGIVYSTFWPEPQPKPQGKSEPKEDGASPGTINTNLSKTTIGESIVASVIAEGDVDVVQAINAHANMQPMKNNINMTANECNIGSQRLADLVVINNTETKKKTRKDGRGRPEMQMRWDEDSDEEMNDLR